VVQGLHVPKGPDEGCGKAEGARAGQSHRKNHTRRQCKGSLAFALDLGSMGCLCLPGAL
jgi:hypothetical protein